MKVCFVGKYNDWFLQGDLDLYELYAITFEPLPIQIKYKFKQIIIANCQDFTPKTTNKHIADIRGMLNNHLQSLIPDCDLYCSFRTVLRGDKPKVVEITSDLYCDYGDKFPYIREAKSPYNNGVLKYVFGNRVVNIDEFKDDSDKESRILIPSTINTSDKLVYNAHTRRSIFSSHERYEQLLHQVKCISTITNSQVYILEGGINVPLSYLRELSKYAIVVLFGQDEKGDYYANDCPTKSYFEFYSIYRMLQCFNNYKWMIKFGGRYTLLRNDSLQQFQVDKPCGHVIDGQYTYDGKTIINSVLFSYPYEYLDELSQKLNQCLENENHKNNSEQIFYHSEMQHIQTLYIYGYDGVCSEMRLH